MTRKTEAEMRREGSRLEKMWVQFDVGRLFISLKGKFSDPETLTLYKPPLKDIDIARPVVMVAYYRVREEPSHMSKSHWQYSDETDTIYSREYVLALNTSGFYSRFRNNQSQFIESPSRLHRVGDLQSLLEANIASEQRKPGIWAMWGAILGANRPAKR